MSKLSFFRWMFVLWHSQQRKEKAVLGEISRLRLKIYVNLFIYEIVVPKRALESKKSRQVRSKDTVIYVRQQLMIDTF